MLDDQARGARVQENNGAIARLLGTGGDQGQGTRPWSTRDSGLHGPVGEKQHSGDDLEPKRAFDLVLHCKLAKVYDPALSRLELVISVAQHREHTRGALGQTRANRLLGHAPSEALERALSAAIEQN